MRTNVVCHWTTPLRGAAAFASGQVACFCAGMHAAPRITQIHGPRAGVQEAVKFARHGHRARLQADDVNRALQLRDVDQMHGTSASDRRRYATVAGTSDVFYVQDTLHNCEDLIYEPLPRPPVEVGVLVHWFLVQGVKPRTPENAVPRQLLERARAQVRCAYCRLHAHVNSGAPVATACTCTVPGCACTNTHDVIIYMNECTTEALTTLRCSTRRHKVPTADTHACDRSARRRRSRCSAAQCRGSCPWRRRASASGGGHGGWQWRARSGRRRRGHDPRACGSACSVRRAAGAVTCLQTGVLSKTQMYLARAC